MLHNTLDLLFSYHVSAFFLKKKERKERRRGGKNICCSFSASSHKSINWQIAMKDKKSMCRKKKVFLFNLCQVYDGLCAMSIEWYRITLKYTHTCDMRVNDLRNQTFCLFTRSFMFNFFFCSLLCCSQQYWRL